PRWRCPRARERRRCTAPCSRRRTCASARSSARTSSRCGSSRKVRRRRVDRRQLALALAWLSLGAAPAVHAEEDLDSVLGGFDREEPEAAPESGEAADRIWDLSGSLEVSGSVNYLAHRSDTGTDYRGLQRLRNRANLQLDIDLPRASFAQ